MYFPAPAQQRAEHEDGDANAGIALDGGGTR
jgi:hypothetical protein